LFLDNLVSAALQSIYPIDTFPAQRSAQSFEYATLDAVSLLASKR